jgi:hypothetical protein
MTLKFVSVDPVTHVITLNKPITVEAGVELVPVPKFEPAPFVTPTITITRLDPAEIKKLIPDPCFRKFFALSS